MEPLLNRWRGTGNLWKWVTGTMVYTVYVAVLIGVVTGSWVAVLATATGMLVGESMGFGKWVGYLCYPELKDVEKEYLDDEGKKFPWIHYVANMVVDEKKDFARYCNVALGIRGLLWGLMLYAGVFALGFISWYVWLGAGCLWAVGFPMACRMSRKIEWRYRSKWLSVKDRWELQEVLYGVFQMLAFVLVVICAG